MPIPSSRVIKAIKSSFYMPDKVGKLDPGELKLLEELENRGKVLPKYNLSTDYETLDDILKAYSDYIPEKENIAPSRASLKAEIKRHPNNWTAEDELLKSYNYENPEYEHSELNEALSNRSKKLNDIATKILKKSGYIKPKSSSLEEALLFNIEEAPVKQFKGEVFKQWLKNKGIRNWRDLESTNDIIPNVKNASKNPTLRYLYRQLLEEGNVLDKEGNRIFRHPANKKADYDMLRWRNQHRPEIVDLIEDEEGNVSYKFKPHNSQESEFLEGEGKRSYQEFLDLVRSMYGD